MKKLHLFFKGIKDPRTSNTTCHDFVEMLIIALVSCLSGAQPSARVGGRLETPVQLTTDVSGPSSAMRSTGGRIRSGRRWGGSLRLGRRGWRGGIRQTAVDVKVLRRTVTRLRALGAASRLRLLSGIVLGQVAVDKKSNEILALPELLEMVDVEGAIITADAIHTQRATSKLIIDKGGDDVLALKANQKSLHRDTKALLDDPENAEKMPSHQNVSRDHGRDETRTATISHDIGRLQDVHRWPGLAVGKITAVRVTVGRAFTRPATTS